jgi:hypothetical protein
VRAVAGRQSDVLGNVRVSAFVNRSLAFVSATLSIVACSGGDDSGSSPTDGRVDGARRDSGKPIFDGGPLADSGSPIPQVCSAVSGKIFWTEPSAGIQSCEISNCATTSAPFDAVDAFTSGSLGMTTDGTHLYWCYYSDICVAELDGSNVRAFAAVNPHPAGMFVDSCNLYWGSYSDTQSLSACALNDCANTITPLAHVAQGYAFGVTADPTEVFFSNHLAGNVYRVALTP